MNYITTKDNSTDKEVKLYYEDLGHGQPVIFIHGWPLSQDMWEYQVTELTQHGIRCISYDRRGFGKSSRPFSGYDYDTLASDLKAVIDGLNLTDVILVGFSMGGGEVVRYLHNYGSEKVSKIVLISSVTPYMLKTADNEEGVDVSVFDEILKGLKEDRPGFLDTFGKQFFGINIINHPVSTPSLDYYRTLCALASPIATRDCAKAFATTDFRKDVESITVPTLIIHGDADKTVPIEASGNRTAQLIPHSQYIVYEGAPHGLFHTHKDQLNQHLLSYFTGAEIMVAESYDILPTNYPI